MRNRFASKAVVLLYHRVAELKTDPQLLGVRPLRFAEHLNVLARTYRVLSLNALAEWSEGCGDYAGHAVAVTFDDGYRDNLVNAKPLLEQYHIPATVFVSTSNLDQSREFWWDELERILLWPSTVPHTLRVRVDGAWHEWNLNQAAHYEEQEFIHYSTWTVTHKQDPTPRQRVYRELCRLLRPRQTDEREQVLEEIRTWAGASRTIRDSHRCLSPDEVDRLGAGNVVEIGAHTVSHPMLSGLSAAKQEMEIGDSKTQLEAIIKRPVTSFAYPYGSLDDYTPETKRLVRAAGFASACSNVPGPVTRWSDRYQLPRFIVRDWSGEEFARRLDRWLTYGGDEGSGDA
jgi:peptidoglycan/xylan/chitin deacetylase (PgdA/CDA1 family)